MVNVRLRNTVVMDTSIIGDPRADIGDIRKISRAQNRHERYDLSLRGCGRILKNMNGVIRSINTEKSVNACRHTILSLHFEQWFFRYIFYLDQHPYTMPFMFSQTVFRYKSSKFRPKKDILQTNCKTDHLS